MDATITENPTDPAGAIDGWDDTDNVSSMWRVGKVLIWSPIMGMWLEEEEHISVKPGRPLHEMEQGRRGLDGPRFQHRRDGYVRIVCLSK